MRRSLSRRTSPAAAKDIAVAFKAKTGDNLVLSFGASGALYTQIHAERAFRGVSVG